MSAVGNYTEITGHPKFRAVVEEEQRALAEVARKYPPIERPISQEQVREQTRALNRSREAVISKFRAKYSQVQNSIYAELGKTVPTGSASSSVTASGNRVIQAHAAHMRKKAEPLLARGCPECRQPSGERCRTASGNTIYGRVHVSRSQKLMKSGGNRMEGAW